MGSGHMVACSPFGPADEFAASRHGALTRSHAAENELHRRRSGGIRCTSIARALADVGRFDSHEQVKVAFEWAWRNGHSLVWRMAAERLRSPRRSGPRIGLELLDAAEAHECPTKSELETRVSDVTESLPGIVRQHRVLRADDSFIGRVDFASPELRIAIEAHGRKHHVGPTAVDSDAVRESEMQAEGWIVRHVTDRRRRHTTIAVDRCSRSGCGGSTWSVVSRVFGGGIRGLVGPRRRRDVRSGRSGPSGTSWGARRR